MLVELLHSIELNMRESLGVFLNNINVITGGVAILASGWITIWAIYRSYFQGSFYQDYYYCRCRYGTGIL